MNIRESFEEREFQELSPYAAHSRSSRGRDVYEPECDIRTVYQRDRDRILIWWRPLRLGMILGIRHSGMRERLHWMRSVRKGLHITNRVSA